MLVDYYQMGQYHSRAHFKRHVHTHKKRFTHQYFGLFTEREKTVNCKCTICKSAKGLLNFRTTFALALASKLTDMDKKIHRNCFVF